MGRKDQNSPPRGIVVSKTLSRVLRHSAEQEKIHLTSQGYAKVSDLLKWHKAKSLKITFAEILQLVEESDKQRFALLHESAVKKADGPEEDTKSAALDQLTDDMQNLSIETQQTATQIALEEAKKDQNPEHYLIRATQGHSIQSIESAEYLEPITLDKPETIPDTVVHGTFHAAWPLIIATGGLKPMNRNHAHFATGPNLQDVMPDGIDALVRPRGSSAQVDGGRVVISGMRHDAQVLIYINIKKALEAGLAFWKSENGVILSEGSSGTGEDERKVISTDFFDVVVETKEGLGLLWQDGNKTKDLPTALVKKGMPRGKGEKDHAGKSQDGKKRKQSERRPKLNLANANDEVEG